MSLTTPAAPSTDEFAERLFQAVLGAQEVHAVYLGDRLGWYRELASSGPLTSTELAERTGTAERYAREWLEHQAVCGFLTVNDAGAAPTDRRYLLPAAQAEVLADEESLAFVAPLARFVAGVGLHLDKILDAYRSGGGVGWHQLGQDPREAQAAANRPLFLHQLAQELLPQIPDVQAKLAAGARVADVGCGGAWSAIGIARAHPGVTVDGFDVDAPSVELARANVAAAGLEERVRIHLVDAAAGLAAQSGTSHTAGPYDVVFAFECLHDLPDPVSVLAGMRGLAGPEGHVIVMDERAEETFTAPGSDLERLLYGYSLTCCLPDCLSHQPSAGTGTVMRPATLDGYARAAGFSGGAEVLAVEHDFFRFYALRS